MPHRHASPEEPDSRRCRPSKHDRSLTSIWRHLVTWQPCSAAATAVPATTGEAPALRGLRGRSDDGLGAARTEHRRRPTTRALRDCRRWLHDALRTRMQGFPTCAAWSRGTLYVLAACDVRQGPLVLHVPDTGGRYYVLSSSTLGRTTSPISGAARRGPAKVSFCSRPTNGPERPLLACGSCRRPRGCS